MSCCGLFKAKAKTRPSPPATLESERSAALIRKVSRKSLPLNPPADTVPTLEHRQRNSVTGAELAESSNSNYCLNVPWMKSTNADRTKATPFHIYAPGVKPRF